MQRTEVLSLPIFDNPKEDLFKIDYFNTGFRNIENIIGQVISSEGKVSVDLTNQEVADARGDFTNLRQRLENSDLQSEKNVQYVNAVAYGKSKNITTNDAINELVQSNKPCYVPNEEIEITTSIVIDKNNYNFKCDGTLKLINENANILIDCMYSNIFINKIARNENIGEAIKIQPVTNTMSAYNNISIGQILYSEKGIYCYANDTKGVQYNKINFNLINASHCIEFSTGEDGGPWINENTFNCGQMCGGIGIYGRKTNSNADLYNGNKFLNGGFENIEKICDLDGFKQNYFLNLRAEENITSDTWIDVANSYSNIFTTSSKIPISKVNVNKTNCRSISIESLEGFRNGTNNYMANKIIFGSDYRIENRNKSLSIWDFFNQDCKPDFIDNDYAWDKLLRVKTSAGNNITFSLLEKYLDINYKNFDFTMEISLAQGTTLNISANGNVIKSITNENSNTQNLVYKVFVYTKDSAKRVINIMKISDSWEEFSIEQNV